MRMFGAILFHQVAGLALFILSLGYGWWALTVFIAEWIGEAKPISLAVQRAENRLEKWSLLPVYIVVTVMGMSAFLALAWGPAFLVVLSVCVVTGALQLQSAVRQTAANQAKGLV